MPRHSDLPFIFRQPRQFDSPRFALQNGFRHFGKNGCSHTAADQLGGLRETGAMVGDAEIFTAFASHRDELILEFPAESGGQRLPSKNLRFALRIPASRHKQRIADFPERMEFQRSLYCCAPDQSEIEAVVGESSRHIS